MKTAIITGSSSGIGLETTKVLLDLGYKVYGIGRDFSKNTIENENYVKVQLDLLNLRQLELKIKEIRKSEDIDLLINNAGCAYYGLHEEVSSSKIHEMVTVNFEVPMILCQLLMRDFKKNHGTIINISSVTAKMSSPHGCCYGATKSGLSHFSSSLFDECRKYGVKVITIHPDLTQSNLYRNADFMPLNDDGYSLSPEEVADAVKYVLNSNEGTVITDITLRPQKNAIAKKKS